MSNKMRWRYVDTRLVVAAVDSATVIEIGDLLWQGDSAETPGCKSAYPAMLLKASDLQTEFAWKFLGVAMQRSRNEETASIHVETTGVFEFDCPSATFELGDLVGAHENTAGDALLNQQVARVGDSRLAIGRVAKREPSAVTSVFIDIRSRVMTGRIL